MAAKQPGHQPGYGRARPEISLNQVHPAIDPLPTSPDEDVHENDRRSGAAGRAGIDDYKVQ